MDGALAIAIGIYVLVLHIYIYIYILVHCQYTLLDSGNVLLEENCYKLPKNNRISSTSTRGLSQIHEAMLDNPEGVAQSDYLTDSVYLR